jgi:hypothetical protein
VVGLSKFDGKDRRRQRRNYQRNEIAKDLGSPKYRQRIKERKRIDDEKGNFHFVDRYYDDTEDD